MVSKRVYFDDFNNPLLPDFAEICRYSDPLYSLFTFISLGLVEIFARRNISQTYSKSTYAATLSCLHENKNILKPDDFQATETFFSIMFSSDNDRTTLSSWIKLYFTENTNQIISRLIRNLVILANKYIFSNKGFTLKEEIISSILAEFCGLFRISIKLFKQSDILKPVLYFPKEAGKYPIIFILQSASQLEFFYLKHKLLLLYDNEVNNSLDLLSPSFTYNLNHQHSKFKPEIDHPINLSLEDDYSKTVESIDSSSQNSIHMLEEELNILEKIIETLCNFIPNQSIVIPYIYELLHSSERLKNNPYIVKLLSDYPHLKCQVCCNIRLSGEFNLLRCRESNKCIVCNLCRKSSPDFCVNCKRNYMAYEIEALHKFNR